jgi:hypothetical protein
LLAILACATLPAQSPVVGRVTSGGKPVPGAVVTIRSGSLTYSTATSEDGAFSWAEAPAGELRVEVSMYGFRPARAQAPAENRGKPLDIALEMIPFMPVGARRGAGAGEPEEVQTVNNQVRAALEATPVPVADPSEASQSFLIQGTVTPQAERWPSGAFLEGMGMGPPGAQPGVPGAPGFGESQAAGAGATPGFGGRGGFGGPGGMGGPGGRGGGPGMGPPGMGGPGMGPPGGPMADRIRERMEQLTPEQRERIERMMAERGGRPRMAPEAFGNAQAGRRRDMIRGGAFFNLRNSALDAAPYALNGIPVDKPSYAQSRFGFTLGGPLALPLAGRETSGMFFVNYNGTRSRNPFSSFSILPGAEERAGVFNVPVYDQQSGLPFPNGVIPESRQDRIARSLTNLIPLPNQPGAVQNFRIVTSVPQDSDMLNLRLSQGRRQNRIEASVNLQGRSGYSLQPYGFRDESEGAGRNYELSMTRNVSRRTILTLRARYNLNRNSTIPYFSFREDISGRLGIVGASAEPRNYGPPNINFTNFGDLTDGAYALRHVRTWNYSASLRAVRGRHSLSTGFDFQRTQWNTLTEQNARGTLLFGGLMTSALDAQGQPVAGTGHDFADFLLGLPQQSTRRAGGFDTYMRSSQYGVFVQDDWQARAGLTFNLGLRYDFITPFTEKYGRMANLDIAPGFAAVAVVTPSQPGPFTGAFPAGLVEPDRNNFAPRVAVAWRPGNNRRLVLRGGYSIFYDNSVYNRIPSRLAAQPPFAQSFTFNTSPAARLTLQDPFTGPSTATIRNTYAIDRYFVMPFAQTWSFSIQQEVRWGLIVEAGYTGTKGIDLVVQRLPNRAAPGSPLTAEQRRLIADASGFNFDSSEGDSIYHGLNLRLMRRQRRGVGWNLLYTWSKSIDNATTVGGMGMTVVQDEKNLAAERGLSSFDRRHTLSFNTMIGSPFGPNGMWVRQPGKLAAALRDWTMTASLTAQTGTPLTARVLGSVADAGGSGATGSARADATGLPVHAGAGYFNLAAFTTPPPGRYGNAGRNTIPGPGMIALNASFGRTFPLFGESMRRSIDVRLEGQNVLNHVNLTSYGTVVNSVSYGLATGAGNMRSLSLALRLRF